MAKPIEPTPVLTGQDAVNLANDMVRSCSPAESTNRINQARDLRAQMMRSKGGRGSSTD